MHLDLATVLVLHPASLIVGSLCFLYVRWRSPDNCGLGKMSAAFLLQALGSLLAGAGEQGQLPYGFWTLTSFVTGASGYCLFWIGLNNLLGERRSGRTWWLMSIPAVLGVVAAVTGFHLVNLYRATMFLLTMGGFALASAWQVLHSLRHENIASRRMLAALLVAKTGIAVATIASIAWPDRVGITPAETFSLLILWQFAIAMLVLIVVKERAEGRLIAVTETDSLTRIRNRHWLFDRLPKMVGPLDAFVVIDIDNFKRVNDQHGHAAGDKVLIATAQAMAAQLGHGKLFARMGGEEFGLFVPAASKAWPLATAEKVRRAVELLTVVHEATLVPVTISAGVAIAAEPMSIAALMNQADTALYAAKRSGRNRVVLFGEHPTLREANDDGLAELAEAPLRGPRRG